MLVDLLLATALIAAVPLALRLDGAAPLAPAAVAGGLASSSLLLDEGVAAASVAGVWAAVCAWLALRQVPPLRLDPLLRALPYGYLVVGAGWLLTSRLGARPLGFGDTIVELTAVHFHYAGFVAPLLTLRLADRLAGGPRGPLARLAFYCVLAATPLTAAGIAFAPFLGAAGALLFAAGLGTGAVLSLVHVAPGSPARALLAVSALSVLVAIALAVLYAFGQWLGTPAPSLPVMARTHGVLNAAGFALAGTLGWLRERERGPEGPLS